LEQKSKETKKKATTEIATFDTESEVQEHPKMQEHPKVHEQSKVESATVGTPRKEKRMTNVLKAVLRPAKMASLVVPKVYEVIALHSKTTIDVEIPVSSDKADPSGFASARHGFDILPEKEVLPAPEATPSEDHEYIIHHASGKND
jgi:hypothetical protein